MTLPPDFEAPLHRALTEPILFAGVPRAVAIAIGTLAAAVALGLRLWVPGAVIWFCGHTLAIWATRADVQFMPVFGRHLKQRVYFDV